MVKYKLCTFINRRRIVLILSENAEHTIPKEHFLTHIVLVEIYANLSFKIPFPLLIFARVITFQM